MIGVITSTGEIDLYGRYHAIFAEHAPELDMRRPEEVARPGDVRFVFTFRPPADAFEGMTGLGAIFSSGAGVDAIMACPSRPPEVPVFRVEDPDQAFQMAGHVAFHVHWHHRDMFTRLAQQARGEWGRTLNGFSPSEKRVGILGFGYLGRAIARGLMGLGYPVSGYSRRAPEPPEPGVRHFHGDGFDDFLGRSDILVNVLPLTPQTRGLIDAACLAKLPRGAALIHIGRGGQVVEADLIAALDAGHLGGASLDVFETEPLPAAHPLWAHPKVVITPHVASCADPVAVVRSVRNRLNGIS